MSWIFISFLVAFGGLVILFLYLLINNQSLHLRMLVVAFVILANIPFLFVMLELESRVQSQVFVKLQSESEQRLMLSLRGNLSKKKIGMIGVDDNIIFRFNPHDLSTGLGYIQKDTLRLELFNGYFKKEIHFPYNGYLSCLKLRLTDEFELEEID
ncbi:MAG: hypothetical protein JXQ96_08285 [Cyclobacteriaceae bacterium]